MISKHRTITAALAAALLAATVAAQVPPVPPVPATVAAPAKGSVNQLNWLVGCWQGTSSRDGSTMNETWFSPRGGRAMGVGLTYIDNKTMSSEAMSLYDEGDSIKLWLRPAGRADVTMTLDSIGSQFAAFSVKDGEVTTQLRYQRKSDTELVATLRIEQLGSRRGADFSFGKTDCAGFFLPVPKETKESERK